jgi:tetratricopeptide (TPR) repeat protein
VIGANPREGTTLARAVLRDAEAPPEARAVAERALGLANRDLGRLKAAIGHLESSISWARKADSPEREAESRATLAIAWLQSGDARRALREADIAAALPGADLARPWMSRALVLQRLGREAEALTDYGRALRAARRSDDRWTEARLLSNRGVLHAYRGDFAAAERDLTGAHRLHTAAGAAFAAAEVLHNLGFVLARRGDMPGALSYYDEAGRAFEDLGIVRNDGLIDRCEALLAVRLLPEARRIAQSAVEGCEAAGRTTDAAEARLMLARACLLEGDYGAARATATAARLAFSAQRRPTWAVLAEFVELQAAAPAGPPEEIERAASRLSRRLARGGWSVPALESLLLAARAALDGGRLGAARAALAAAPSARRRGPAAMRVRAWHAEALLRLAGGDERAALAALRAGLRVADEYRATLGATELRVHAGAVGAELAELGTSLAVASGRPGEVLAWAERWHARLLDHPAARPPRDEESVRLLGLLRETVSRIGVASLDGEDTSPLVRRQYALEMEIRRRSLASRGTAVASAGGGPATLRALRDRLGSDRCLVELVTRREELAAVVVTDRGAELVALGSSTEIERERSALLFALGRVARRRGSREALRTAATALGHAGRRLDELLIAPLAPLVGGRELVVVPTGQLHALAWSLLPSLRGRPLTIAPSASHWLQRDAAPATSPSPARGTVALVAGPGVGGAAAEITRVRDTCYPSADMIEADEATCARVGVAFEQADLVHVAAHGEFRADNPLFSCLVLADGPLTVYDMEAFRKAPSCLVLSACDAGLSTAPHGGEPMGPMAALLGIGTRSLVASVTPVPDEGAAEVMLAFHERLAAGAPPAHALAAAQDLVIDGAMVPDRVEEGDGAALAAVAASGYVCFGSG